METKKIGLSPVRVPRPRATVKGLNDNGVEVELPGKFWVCGTCKGVGQMFGLQQTVFDSGDDDFKHQCREGRLDLLCPACLGERVVSVMDINLLSEKEHDWYMNWDRQKEKERSEKKEKL